NRFPTHWHGFPKPSILGPRRGANSAPGVLRREFCPMDELLRDFLTETGESLDVVDVELVRFEQEPNNTKILDNIFRLVHTIKGTGGFVGWPRLEGLTHAAEALMGNFRGGRPVTGEAVTLVLATIDRIKSLLDELERNQAEPAGDDRDLIERLLAMAADAAPQAKTETKPEAKPESKPERRRRPDEVPLAEIERALRAAGVVV